MIYAPEAGTDDRIAQAEARARAAEDEAAAARREAALLHHHLAVVEASTLWRLGAPLRRIGRDHPRLVRILRGLAGQVLPRRPAAAPPDPAPPDRAAEQPPPLLPGPLLPGPLLPGPAQQARDPAGARKIILVVDHAVPRPDQDGGSRAIFDVMTCLIEAGWRVSFWPQDRRPAGGYTAALEALGIAVFDSRWPTDLAGWLAEHAAALDHVLVSRATVAADLAMAIAAQTAAPLAYYGHDIAFRRLGQQAEIQPSAALRAEAQRMAALERRLWRFFDRVIYLSEEEAEMVRRLEPAADARSVVPFCYDAFPDRPHPPAGRTILFVAGFAHAPNADAAAFLAHEVLPLLQARCPAARLALVGSHPTAAVTALAGRQVEVTGWVSEAALAQRYRESRAAVVPLRFGAGVKGKVVQALQQGLPLVVTPVGAQGLPGLAEIVPVRQAPQEIAAALLTLLEDDAAWRAQSAAQTRFARARYSRAAMRASVLRALE